LRLDDALIGEDIPHMKGSFDCHNQQISTIKAELGGKTWDEEGRKDISALEIQNMNSGVFTDSNNPTPITRHDRDWSVRGNRPAESLKGGGFMFTFHPVTSLHSIPYFQLKGRVGRYSHLQTTKTFKY